MTQKWPAHEQLYMSFSCDKVYAISLMFVLLVEAI